MVVLRFDMQGEDIFEHTNDKCHMCKLKSTNRAL